MTTDVSIHNKVESILNDVDTHLDGIANDSESHDDTLAKLVGNNSLDEQTASDRGISQPSQNDPENQENVDPLPAQAKPVSKPYQSPKNPIKFKVRKVNHEPNVNVEDLKEQRKQLKLVQLQYEQVNNKINKIHKEVRFLKNLLPPYNVEIDYSTRMKINKSIDKLLARVDELNKEKHHLGITLSRIWRDFDDSDLWVRTMSQ